MFLYIITISHGVTVSLSKFISFMEVKKIYRGKALFARSLQLIAVLSKIIITGFSMMIYDKIKLKQYSDQ